MNIYNGRGARVLREYGPIDFVSLSDDDPIIKAHNTNSLGFKRAHGYGQMNTHKMPPDSFEALPFCKCTQI